VSEHFNLLIAEDDQLLANSVKQMIPSSFKVFLCSDPTLIPEHIFFHAAFVDMHIVNTTAQGPDGLAVIQKLIRKNPHTEIVAMSGEVVRQIMDAAIHAGAQRFLAKPLMFEEVSLVIEKILAYWQLRQLSFAASTSARKFIGSSEHSEELRKKISSLKNEKSPILIEGETGTGKEVMATLINSQEGKKPFVVVNCAAITDSLFESELFGHVKGAFTGADQNKIGLAEAANGGDLFFDEIEALPLQQQAKLLRFIESGELRRVGAKEPVKITVRVIAASNRPLLDMVKEKTFREDLFYRLSSHRVQLKPLRERKNDIEELALYFLEIEKPRRNKSFDLDAISELKNYSWPGNVRELKRICEQLVLTSPLPMITKNDIRQILLRANPASVVDFPMERLTSLDDFLGEQEKKIIQSCLEKTKNLDQICTKKLRITG
jgi:DNA-binding NtrC family response regulator